MYDKGNGVSENDETAVKWFKLAAEQGYADAQNYLGVMYENGKRRSTEPLDARHPLQNSLRSGADFPDNLGGKEGQGAK